MNEQVDKEAQDKDLLWTGRSARDNSIDLSRQSGEYSQSVSNVYGGNVGMRGKIAGIGLIMIGIGALCVLSYQLGASQKEVKIITEKVEVIKYVEKKKAAIYSKPNADKCELLKRMRGGIL